MQNKTQDDQDKLHLWRCINGHEYKSVEPFSLKFYVIPEDGEADLSYYIDICPYCYFDWIASHVPACKDMGVVEEEDNG